MASAQVNVTLHMTQKLGGEPFAYNTSTQSSMGYGFNVTRLQYYVSEIKLVHDGGLVTSITDLYLLVDPALDTAFELGSFPISNLEKIQFSIGVDNAHNHLDPTSYASNHPLSPKNPTMHWGWTSGYRFIAFEGYAGADTNAIINNYQIHTVGDANYRTIILDVNGELNNDNMTVHIQADYEHLLDAINASGGLISHASTGASKKIADNTSIVFSAPGTTGIVEAGIVGSFNISPNPASDVVTVSFDIPMYEHMTFTVSDVTGRPIYTREIENLGTSFLVDTRWPSGIYIARMVSNGKLLAIEKFVVE